MADTEKGVRRRGEQAVKKILADKKGGSELIEVCLAVLLSFIIAGLLINLFVPEFKTTIIPSIIQTLKDIVTI